MINLMVCDLFMFLNMKKNAKVNCLFHTLSPIAGFTLGFSGWGLLWELWRREVLINDGAGDVYIWDSYAETAVFSTYLFYCFTEHDDKYVRFVGVCIGGVWFFVLRLTIVTPFLCYHSFWTFRALPFTAMEAFQSCYSIKFLLYLSELPFEQGHQNLM